MCGEKSWIKSQYLRSDLDPRLPRLGFIFYISSKIRVQFWKTFFKGNNMGPHSKYLSLVRTSTSKWIWANKSAMFGKAWTQMCHRMWVDMSHRWKHTLQHTIHSIASQDVTQDYSEWQDVTQSKAQVKNLGHPESVVFSALSCYLLHSCLDGIHGTWWF